MPGDCNQLIPELIDTTSDVAGQRQRFLRFAPRTTVLNNNLMISRG